MRGGRRIAGAVLAGLVVAPALHGQDRGTGYAEIRYHEALYTETVRGDGDAAMAVYRDVLAHVAGRGPVAARVHLRLARCYEQRGAMAQAAASYVAVQRIQPADDPLAVEAAARGRALAARVAAGDGAAPDRAVVTRELAALKRELEDRRREVTARDREVQALSARVAELEALLLGGGREPAAELAAIRAERVRADRSELEARVADAAQALRDGRHATAIGAARRALELGDRLEAAGAPAPDIVARARELRGAAAKGLLEREWRAAEPAARPIRAVVTLLVAPSAVVATLDSAAGIRFAPAEAVPAAGGSGAAVAHLDQSQVAGLLGLRGVRGVDGGRREVTGEGPPTTTLVGQEDGPGCLIRLRAARGPGGVDALTVEITAWRPLPVPLAAAGVDLPRRALEHVRITHAVPEGHALLVAGVRSPFPANPADESEELLLLVHPPPPAPQTGEGR